YTLSLIEKPQLRRGSRSELVRRVQQVLKDGRFYKGIVDGDFGRQTEEAVKALQKEHNPSGVNGIINDETWQALVELATMLTSN
ncbi:MAG: peptidoglycan-binding protein, partial [Coleofasciculus sp. S288]|nr:peptidoglycan-binding protein [Coleofasciculus sp. S288]